MEVEGEKIDRLLVEEKIPKAHELYAGITLDPERPPPSSNDLDRGRYGHRGSRTTVSGKALYETSPSDRSAESCPDGRPCSPDRTPGRGAAPGCQCDPEIGAGLLPLRGHHGRNQSPHDH